MVAHNPLHRTGRAVFPHPVPELVDAEWGDWYRLSPVERWLQSEKLWETFLTLGPEQA